MSDARRKEYRDYMRSMEWAERSRAALARAGYKCQRCGRLTGLEVHHLTYKRFRQEAPEDLLVVCRSCHKDEDRERIERARIRGFARKKYGDDWEERVSLLQVETEFYDWLQWKEWNG